MSSNVLLPAKETLMMNHMLTPFLSEEQIQMRIQELAANINQTYAGTQKLIVIAVLKGAFMFLSDLVRHVNVPCHVEFVRLSSYGNNKNSSGTVKPVDLSLPDLANEDVLVVEDIIDTGLTMSFLIDYLHSLHKTKSLRLAALLDKPAARSKEIASLAIDFRGFTVGNEFLVGYGLDLAGYYRNLPYIALVQEETTEPASEPENPARNW